MADAAMDFTGEQVVKGTTPDRIYQDHVARYRHAVPRVQGLRVLDVACGTGYGAHLLAEGGAAAVEGVDISEKAVAHAKATFRAPGLRFQAGSLLDLPFPDGSFDAATCFETIEHVDDPRKGLEELRRVLRPGGLLLVSTPNRPVTSPLKGLRDPPNNRYHVQEWTVREFKALLRESFSIERGYGQRQRPRLLFAAPVYRLLHRRRRAWYKPELGDPTPAPLRAHLAPRYVLFECRRP